MEGDLTISEETAHHHADVIAKHLTKFAEHMRRLFLVENMVDSLKVMNEYLFICHWNN